jgi:hypothetical protein
LEFFVTAAAVLLAAVAASWSAWVIFRADAGADAAAADDVAPTLIEPARRSSDLPPAVVPELPEGAGQIAPLTVRVRIETRTAGGAVRTVEQVVSRSTDRVHVRTTDGPEWYFERNPRDVRRASGALIDHGSRSVVLHGESDLRNELGISGWAQVLTLGVDPTLLLVDQEPSPRTRSIDGVVFAQYRMPAASPSTADLWWNARHALPGELRTRSDAATMHLVVTGISHHVDATLLEPPGTRFPDYRLVDLADWREGH